jgi:hypothetical protein
VEFADERNPATPKEPAIVSLPVIQSEPPIVESEYVLNPETDREPTMV